MHIYLTLTLFPSVRLSLSLFPFEEGVELIQMHMYYADRLSLVVYW